MKCHKYSIVCYESALELSHEMGHSQTRVYIPGQGVFGYRSSEQIDFFSSKEETISEAERILKGSVDNGERYIGEVELPEELVLGVISAGTNFNNARKQFSEVSKSLIDILQESA